MHTRIVAAIAAVAVVVAAGCSDASADGGTAPRVIQPGAPGEPTRELTPEEVAALDLEIEHTDADVAFMQGMIPHHVQALWMARLVRTNTSNDRLALFSERLELSQRDEIDLMTAWLEARDEEVPPLLQAHEHDDGQLMPGMLTTEEFARLEAARDHEFDRLFLEFMIQHHLGALWMVEQLYEEDGGAEPELAVFANHVVSDQQIEISRMQELLAQMAADGLLDDGD